MPVKGSQGESIMNAKLNKFIVVIAVLYFAPTSMAHGDLLDGQTLGLHFSTIIFATI
jgi:hypothetical protein